MTPHRFPRMAPSPSLLHHLSGNPNAFHTAGVPPFKRYLPSGFAGNVSSIVRSSRICRATKDELFNIVTCSCTAAGMEMQQKVRMNHIRRVSRALIAVTLTHPNSR